jgi:hypothetical protein
MFKVMLKTSQFIILGNNFLFKWKLFKQLHKIPHDVLEIKYFVSPPQKTDSLQPAYSMTKK